MACSNLTLIASALLLVVALAHSAPADTARAPLPVNPDAAEKNQDLAVEDKDDLKPAASHWGGIGYGYGGYGGYGGWGGHYGGYYPYYSSWGYPGYGYGGYGGYGYGWPYGGYGGFGGWW